MVTDLVWAFVILIVYPASFDPSHPLQYDFGEIPEVHHYAN
jgi:hypothetical protein